MGLTNEPEADTITIPIYCVSCEQDVESILADPLALLFGGGTVRLVCPYCGLEQEAEVT